jgi:spermidine synthase
MRHRFLLACLVLSGFSGLAYELLWTRLLSVSFGSTTLSFSTVLAVFFGGLALGAHLAGKRAQRVRRPVRAYGLIELLTGLCGLLLHPILTHLGGLFAMIDPGPGLTGAVARFLVAVPILIAPTVLMGATLPIVCSAMIEQRQVIGRGTALIYGFNTLGACLGAYLVTYQLLETLGVQKTILLTAGANFAVAAIAIAVDRREARHPPDPEPPPPVAASEIDPHRGKLILIASALTLLGGFAAICLQVVWVRLFSIFLGGTVFALGAVLIAVLIGIAAGSLGIARILDTSRHAAIYFAALQILTVGSVILTSRIFEWVDYELNGIALALSGTTILHAQLAVVLVVLLIPTCCSGASFPLLMKIAERDPKSVGRSLGVLYASNTFGSILGSLVTGFVLIPRAGAEATIFVALVLLSVVGSIGAFLFLPKPRRIVGLAAAPIAILVLQLYQGFDMTGLQLGPSAPSWREHLQRVAEFDRQVIYFAEGSYADVAVAGDERWRAIRLNGLTQGSFAKVAPHYVLESVLVAMVPLAHTTDPRHGLVVGLGAGGTVNVLRELGLESVKVVEIEPEVATAVGKLFDRGNPLDAPGVELEINDARHYLLVNARPGRTRYDVITSMPAHPWVAASIFTREFFELARASLSEKGVFCTWFGTSRLELESTQSLLRAFAEVFPYYIVYWVKDASAFYLVGALHPLTIDIDRFETLSKAVDTSDHPALRDPYYLLRRIYATGDPETGPLPSGPSNTDDSVIVETHALPSTGTVGDSLKDFMPSEYLRPAFVAEPKRRTFYIELLEQLLGTPMGEIQVAAKTLDVERAERTIEGTKALWTETELAYFEGRVLEAKGQMRRAREELAKASVDTTLGARARKFAALAAEDPWRVLAELEQLEPTSDVLARMLEIDATRALVHIPSDSVEPARDPIGWFLRRARGEGELDEGDRLAFDAYVGPILAKTKQEHVLELCETFTRKHRLARELGACSAWLAAARQQRADGLLRDGRALLASRTFSEAARVLGQANAARPGDKKIVSNYARALAGAQDEAGLAELVRELRFRGEPEHVIESLIERARAGKLDAGPTEP